MAPPPLLDKSCNIPPPDCSSFYCYLVIDTRKAISTPTSLIHPCIARSFFSKVEINNTDAEGRLVLGDGVALASKTNNNNNGDDNGDRLPGPPVNLIVDMATLTGAQLVTTGKTAAAVMSNRGESEQMAVAAGLHSGDLVFPVNATRSSLRRKVRHCSNHRTTVMVEQEYLCVLCFYCKLPHL